jgi:hypothetical protein
VRNELQLIESRVISKLEAEFKQPVDRDVGIGDTGVSFDAVFTATDVLTFIEIKAMRYPNTGSMLLDRVLYNALVVDRYMKSKFKLVVVIVHYFDPATLARIEGGWRQRAANALPM